MQCLIVGYGSIGKRHAKILDKLGAKIFLVTSQEISEYPYFSTIKDALDALQFDYVIIANQTYLHYSSLIELIDCGYKGIVLIEKPLFSQKEVLPSHSIKQILIGYNLRFCKIIKRLKNLLESETVIGFSVNVGQYLPTWRQDIDYRDCYSAKKIQGGGVLRDLSHELDYCFWLCGSPQYVTALGGHFSNLEIDSEDIFSILMQCDSCPVVNLQLNYLDRTSRREILIHTQSHTIFADLKKGLLQIDGSYEEFENDLTNSYVEQHKAIQSGDFHQFCSYDDGLRTVSLIDKIINETESHKWIKL